MSLLSTMAQPLVSDRPAPQQAAAKSGPSFHIPALDGLRGLAALAAVAFHYLHGPAAAFVAFAWFNDFLACTPIAIDTFFILSGFLIGSILLRYRESPNYYKAFYLRRVHRILPVYYIWLCVYFAFFLFAKGWGLRAAGSHSTVFTFASCIFFFQNFIYTIIESSYIAAPIWTLAVEEHFYLISPLLVRKLSKRGLVRVLVGVVVIVPLIRGAITKLGHGTDWSSFAVELWTVCRVDALALGMILAVVWRVPSAQKWVRERYKLYWPGVLVFTALSFLCVWTSRARIPHTFVLTAVLTRTLMELSCLSLMLLVLARPDSWSARFLSSKVMREFGRISYCLYLIHWGILWIIVRFVLHTTFGARLGPETVAIVAAFVISCGLSQLSWKYLEAPLIERGRRFAY